MRSGCSALGPCVNNQTREKPRECLYWTLRRRFGVSLLGRKSPTCAGEGRPPWAGGTSERCDGTSGFGAKRARARTDVSCFSAALLPERTNERTNEAVSFRKNTLLKRSPGPHRGASTSMGGGALYRWTQRGAAGGPLSCPLLLGVGMGALRPAPPRGAATGFPGCTLRGAMAHAPEAATLLGCPELKQRVDPTS